MAADAARRISAVSPNRVLNLFMPNSDQDTPRTVLICHHDDPLNRNGLARWLAATMSLAGVIVIEENRQRKTKRLRREIQRVGWLRFLDVLAFRLYFKAFLSESTRAWEQRTLAALCERFSPVPDSTQWLTVSSPNASEVESFVRDLQPNLMVARCKTLLKKDIFSIPTHGTFVMHPGICPQYRNAHGGFWALAMNDRANVGMTLLKIDTGIDTGPVYGFFRCLFEELRESHLVIQHKTVFDNLDAIRDRLFEIYRGEALPLPTTGAPSREWGQPWLTAYWKYIAAAKKAAAAPSASPAPREVFAGSHAAVERPTH